MSRRLTLPLFISILLAAPVVRAQSNVFSFTGNDGKFYRHISVVRVDDEEVLYTVEDGAGGGRIKLSQLPESIADEIKALKPREKTFADGLSTAMTKPSTTVEAASSNRAGNGEKSDSATLALTNPTARALCTLSRKVSTNDIGYLIAITYYGTNYLGLGTADSLTFDADGALVTYSPVPGTHRVETGDGQTSETQVYSSSLRDLEKICQAQTLGIALSGPLGNDTFAVPPANILKNFGRYCYTNAPTVAVMARAQAVSNRATNSINYQPDSQPVGSQPAEVLEATARTIDDDPYTTQWAWKVRLRAPTAPPKDFLLEFQFLDADGYVLAHEVEYPVKLNAGQTNTLTGQTGIKTALSGKIKTCKVVMK